MAPLEVFSPTMRDVAHITPHAWANEGFADLVQDGGDLLDIMPQLGVFTAMGTALIGVAACRLRRSITAT
jgi:ABC-2 type transport system permease protein